MINLLPTLADTVEKVTTLNVPEERKQVLQPLMDYIQSKLVSKEIPNLNFICTHNSRRSQFSQIWAQTAADFYQIPALCYSGGVEVTAFNERAVASIERGGFKVSSQGETNPVYFIRHSEVSIPIISFSKVFDNALNQVGKFAAVMTCSHADENCPFIPGAELRTPVRYEDPKAFDDTDQELIMYDERSMQIASEMFYVFSQLKF